MGILATIGRKSAAADFGFIRVRGATAWWLWGIVHVRFLLGSRNRAAVALNWVCSYIAYWTSTRLITPSTSEARNGDQAMSH
jgi:NADH dehydrogenase/putative oxidoreductase